MSRTDQPTGQAYLLEQVINDKDRNALGVLYATYHARVYQYVANHVGSATDAEDIAQNVFVHLWETHTRYEARKPAEAYLFSTARRAIAEHARKEKGRLRKVMRDPTEDDIAEYCWKQSQDSTVELLKTCQGMAMNLSPKVYEAFELRLVRGLSVQEGARIAGCSVKAFYARVARARRALQQMVLEAELS